MHHSTTITLLPLAEITNASNRLICLLQGALIPLITGDLQAAGLASSGPELFTQATPPTGALIPLITRDLQAAGLAPSGPELLMVVPSPFFLT